MGDGSRGQLGLGADRLSSKSPQQLKCLERLAVASVSCGECHTAFVTASGQLLACGDNRHGKLGHSQRTFTSVQCEPVAVDKYRALHVTLVACGGCHMILVGQLRAAASERGAG
jgi:X-linked retinitis pigmentosa GTPase regulator